MNSTDSDHHQPDHHHLTTHDPPPRRVFYEPRYELGYEVERTQSAARPRINRRLKSPSRRSIGPNRTENRPAKAARRWYAGERYATRYAAAIRTPMRIFKRTGRSPQSGRRSASGVASCGRSPPAPAFGWFNHATSSVGHFSRLDGCGLRRKAGTSSSFFDLLSEELDIAHNLFRWGGVDFSTKCRRFATAESISKPDQRGGRPAKLRRSMPTASASKNRGLSLLAIDLEKWHTTCWCWRCAAMQHGHRAEDQLDADIC